MRSGIYDLLRPAQWSGNSQLNAGSFVQKFHQPVIKLHRVFKIRKDISSSPDLKQKLLVVSLGLAAGYFAKLLIGGRSRNPLKRLLGAGIQLMVTRAIVQNQDVLNAVGTKVVDMVRHRQ